MFEAYHDVDSERQLAMVIDLNKCMGCQTCSVACKRLWTSDEDQEHMWWNKVNTMPGKGSPKNWEDMGGGFDARGFSFSIWRLLGGQAQASELPDVDDFGEYMSIPHESVLKGQEADERTAPDSSPNWTYNWDEDRGGGEYPNSYFFYLPRLCNHCSRPACLEACPRDAIYKRDEDGLVLIDEERCEGYRFCMEACPYKVIYFNPERGTVALGEDQDDALKAAEQKTDGDIDSEEGEFRDISELNSHSGEKSSGDRGIAQKCIGCFPRVEQGVPPACVRQCPGRARFYGYLDNSDGPVHKLVREWGVALPLHPEYNTEPNVYYVPPLSSPKIEEDGRSKSEKRIPLDYLESLFGDEVEKALDKLRRERKKKKRGDDSELLDLLIGWRWPDDFFGEFTNHPQDLHDFGPRTAPENDDNVD